MIKWIILFFNGDIIGFVYHYKYLGVEFQQNDKFTLAIENRIAKANTAASIFSVNHSGQFRPSGPL